MAVYRLSEHSKKLLGKYYKNDPEIKEIVKEILEFPLYNPNKPKTISRFKGKQKKGRVLMHYKALNLNLEIFYNVFTDNNEIDIITFETLQDAHKKNILRKL